MKMLSAYARNLAAAIGPKGVMPTAEIVLILSEPGYDIGATGDLVPVDELEVLRFVARPAALRDLAKYLSAVADESELEAAVACRLGVYASEPQPAAEPKEQP